eukprot:Clim_evm35s157 gene=Clim_evmTU35s157
MDWLEQLGLDSIDPQRKQNHRSKSQSSSFYDVTSPDGSGALSPHSNSTFSDHNAAGSPADEFLGNDFGFNIPDMSNFMEDLPTARSMPERGMEGFVQYSHVLEKDNRMPAPEMRDIFFNRDLEVLMQDPHQHHTSPSSNGHLSDSAKGDSNDETFISDSAIDAKSGASSTGGARSDDDSEETKGLDNEQKRRYRIKKGFERLQKVTPTCKGPEAKVNILNKAADYIEQIHRQQAGVTNEDDVSQANQLNKRLKLAVQMVEMLKKQKTQLQNGNEKLKSRLASRDAQIAELQSQLAKYQNGESKKNNAKRRKLTSGDAMKLSAISLLMFVGFMNPMNSLMGTAAGVSAGASSVGTGRSLLGLMGSETVEVASHDITNVLSTAMTMCFFVVRMICVLFGSWLLWDMAFPVHYVRMESKEYREAMECRRRVFRMLNESNDRTTHHEAVGELTHGLTLLGVETPIPSRMTFAFALTVQLIQQGLHLTGFGFLVSRHLSRMPLANPVSNELARIYGALAQTFFLMNNVWLGTYCCLMSINMAEHCGAVDTLVKMYVMYASNMIFRVPRWMIPVTVPISKAYRRRVATILENNPCLRRRTQAIIAFSDGWDQVAWGDMDTAIAKFSKVNDIYTDAGSTSEAWRSKFVQITAMLMAGQFEKAAFEAHKLVLSTSKGSDEERKYCTLLMLAYCTMNDDTIATSERAMADANKITTSPFKYDDRSPSVLMFYTIKGWLALRNGDIVDAINYVDAFMDAVESLDSTMSHLWPFVFLCLGTNFVTIRQGFVFYNRCKEEARNEPELARLRRLESWVRCQLRTLGHTYPMCKGRYLLVSGHYSRAQGDKDKALSILEKALTENESSSLRADAAMVHVEFAKLFPNTEEGFQHIQAAKRELYSLGIMPIMRECEVLQQKLFPNFVDHQEHCYRA